MKVKSFFILLALFFSTGFCQEKVVILGSGPAGLTAAIFAAQANLSPLVVEGNECDGQLTIVQKIENFPGYPEGIRGDELIEKMQQQAKKFNARFCSAAVLAIDLSQRPFQLQLSDGTSLYTESLIITLGTIKKWLGLPSEEALKGKGVHGSATCDGERYIGKDVVVVGGTDSALEEALTLSQVAQKVTIVWRNDNFNAAAYLKERVEKQKNIDVIFNTEITEIYDVKQGYVTGVKIINRKTAVEGFFPCDGIFISIGRRPNSDLFHGQLVIGENGYIVTGPQGTNTNIPGVFAAGDVADSIYRKVSTAVGSGCMAAIDAIKFLANNPQVILTR